MPKKKQEVTEDEADRLSRVKAPAMPNLGHDDDEEHFDFGDDDAELSALNDPEIEHLSEPPLISGRSKPSSLFGVDADTFGRPTSPKLYAQAAQFPEANQFRVWRWENGIPVGLGAIDAQSNEDDFVRDFFDAMPKPGEGRFQFRLRPVDIRGEELGKEFTLTISEHHSTLKRMREAKKREAEEGMMSGMPGGAWGRGAAGGGDIIVNPGGSDAAGASYAEEMGRMFEQAVEASESRSEALQRTLEEERARLREEEKRRAEERISMAERSAGAVQQMTEKLMESDRARSKEAIEAQEKHSGFMLNTLTSVFSQQQESARQQADRMREMDQFRMQQDREFFERQRVEMEAQRAREREESERKRLAERDEWERRRQEDRERARVEQEARELEARRREEEAERKRLLEKEEMHLRFEREKLELEARREQMRTEREIAKQELEERRLREQQEFERKMLLEREERERRERADRERWERERLEADRKREEERREWERREQMRREEMQRETERRREEMQLQMKQMEMTAQRDREHAERMLEMSRLERESQREAGLNREKQEREAREAAERDRQRQHDMALREMEMAKERDREHQERMMQLAKIQQGGGLGGITELLGMETADVLAKIFSSGGGEEKDGGWADAIPKVIGSIAEIGKVAMTASNARGGGEHGKRQVKNKQERMIAIQTPDGIQMIPASQLSELQAAMQQHRGIPMPVGAQPQGGTGDLPAVPFIPPEQTQKAQTKEAEPTSQRSEKAPASEDNTFYGQGLRVDTLKRAKEAGLALKDQRTARKAIRKLGDKLAKAEQDDWYGLVAEAIAADIAIYHYIEAVSVYAALAEAKVEPELADKIVAALRESGMIPDTIPYTEEDWIAKQQAAQNQEGEGA